MFLPLGTNRPLKRRTVVNHGLIGANALVFVGSLAVMQSEPEMGERAHRALALDPRDLQPWAFFTYQFLHGGLLHLLGNMIFLYVFGPNVEDRLGRVWYLLFYLLGGAAAGGLHTLFEQAPVVGASGAIAAVTGAYLVFFPRTIVKVLVFFIVIGVFQIPALWFIGFEIAKNLFFQGLGGGGGVAYLAHLGGYGFGAGVSLLLLATGLRPREPYDLFSLGRQAQRRRAFRSQVQGGESPWQGRPARAGASAPTSTADSPKESDENAAARSRIHTLIRGGRLEEAARVYRDAIAGRTRFSVSPEAQLQVANQLQRWGEHRPAAEAYAAFLERFTSHPEAGQVKLMLGLLYGRYLGQPERARTLVREAADAVRGEQEREFARSLLEEFGEGAV